MFVLDIPYVMHLELYWGFAVIFTIVTVVIAMAAYDPEKEEKKCGCGCGLPSGS